jgi:hypothetical protein
MDIECGTGEELEVWRDSETKRVIKVIFYTHSRFLTRYAVKPH